LAAEFDQGQPIPGTGRSQNAKNGEKSETQKTVDAGEDGSVHGECRVAMTIESWHPKSRNVTLYETI
jgi:hypothetical protein